MSGDSGSHDGFWKTTLGYLTQVGIILGAVAGIVAGIAALTGDGSPPPAEEAERLPSDCVAALADTGDTGGAGAPESLDSIDVAPRPAAIAIGGRAAWVAHTDGRVTRIPVDAPDSRVDPLDDVLVGTDRRGMVSIAYGLGAVWVTKRERDPSAGFLVKLDTSGDEIEQIELDQPDNVAADAGFVWITHDSGQLTRMEAGDLDSRREEAIGGNPHGVWAANAPCVYVATTDPDGFAAFRAATGARIGEPFLAGPGQEIVAGAGALWMTEAGGDRVLRVDPEEPDHAEPVDVGITPSVDALAAGAGAIWTAGDDTVVHVDPSSRSATPITVGGRPMGIAIGGDPELVWVARHDSGRVTRITP